MIIDLKKKRVCVGCGDKGKVFDGNKWYCGIDFATAHGGCKKNKTINNIPKVSK